MEVGERALHVANDIRIKLRLEITMLHLNIFVSLLLWQVPKNYAQKF